MNGKVIAALVGGAVLVWGISTISKSKGIDENTLIGAGLITGAVIIIKNATKK